ncbi:uncharacterized protein LOC119655830 [Hermetia illucens]|nr:uncharacterized protein LOC119655830 [Hermetia illucens]
MTHVIRNMKELIIPCLIITISIGPIWGLEHNGDDLSDRTNSKQMKPSYVRTELKVSRSLNHDDVETIDVKSSTGGLASIIVKKRPEGRLHPLSGAYHKSTRTNQNSTGTSTSNIEYGKWNPLSSSVRFADPTNAASLQVINSFLDHVSKIDRQNWQERQDRQQTIESAIKNDRRPVNIVLARQVPEPTVVRSDTVFVKSTPSKNSKRGRSLMHIDSDGIPVVEGIRVPDDEEDKKKTWRNARVIKGELVPYEKGYVPPKVEVNGELIFSNSQRANEYDRTSIGPFTKSDNYPNEAKTEGRSYGPFTVDDNKRSKHDQSDRRGGGPFFVADNAGATNQKLFEYIRQVNSDPQWYVARSSKHYDAQRSHNSPPQLQRRMLPAGNDFQQDANFLNDIDDVEGFRNPIFEYAHPELGIQPARALPKKPEPAQFKKVQYYVNDNVNSGNNKKKFTAIHTTPLNSNEYYQNDPYYNSYKPTATYPFNIGYLNKVKEQPFWLKISEQVRDSFQSGMTSVGAITRPVFEPIVEAGQKISENLGLSKGNRFAEKKVGVVGPVAATSAILPAIGLVAGGAALGIGAMAVGKYFDGNLLKREESESLLDPEHKRAMEAIYGQSNGEVYVVGETSEPQSQNQQNYGRRKRSLPIRNHITFLDIQQPTIGVRPSQHSDGQSDIGDLLQNVEKALPNTLTSSFEEQIRRTDWTNTACAKKTFCEVMLNQNSDQMVLMEKKMETLLATMHPKASASISSHLTDVIQAINQRNCGVFMCVTQ